MMEQRDRTERIYVKVLSEIDPTGYIVPKTIIWKDGRNFVIDRVRFVRPGQEVGDGRNPDDCFLITVRGQERRLYFTRSLRCFHLLVGRWYVERPLPPDEAG